MAGFTELNKSVWPALIFALMGLMAMPTQAAKLGAGQDPADFYPEGFYLTPSEMQDILAPGVFWCIEPQGNSCAFTTVMNAQDGAYFYYGVVEKWDENTILSAPVEGYLREDGILCETVTGIFDHVTITSTRGSKIKRAQVDAIIAELEDMWSDDVGTQFCFTYARINPKHPEQITQFMYRDGVYIDSPYMFIIDDSENAAEKFSLRDF